MSRFNFYEFAPSVEDWLNWAEIEGIDSRVTNFISENPDFLELPEVLYLKNQAIRFRTLDDPLKKMTGFGRTEILPAQLVD